MQLDAGTCRTRFATARSAHLATTGADLAPHVVPVTFALMGDEVVIAVDHKPKTTVNLQRLRNLAQNPRAALLVDRYDDDWANLWWVRADGIATVEHDGPGHAEAIDALAARYPQYLADRPHGPVIRVRVERWSGWAFTDPEEGPAGDVS